jgi:hypothetical protein
MIGYSDNSLESRWYRDYSIKIHKQRLKDIKGRSPENLSHTSRYYSTNRRKQENLFKINDICRENSILYDKLSQISVRKCSPAENKGPKSLNIATRKKEAQRIIKDNLEIIKRLTEKESFVSARKLEEEYYINKKYKKTISKVSLQDRLTKIMKNSAKLPPLGQEGMPTDKSRTLNAELSVLELSPPKEVKKSTKVGKNKSMQASEEERKGEKREEEKATEHVLELLTDSVHSEEPVDLSVNLTIEKTTIEDSKKVKSEENPVLAPEKNLEVKENSVVASEKRLETEENPVLSPEKNLESEDNPVLPSSKHPEIPENPNLPSEKPPSIPLSSSLDRSPSSPSLPAAS